MTYPAKKIANVNGETILTVDSKYLWKCPNGHALGVRAKFKNLSRVLLFRVAVGVTGDETEIPARLFMGWVDSALDIRCTLCDEKRSLYPSDEFKQKIKRQ